MSDRLEGQRQEQEIQLCYTKAGELEQWFTIMQSAVTYILEPKPLEETDMEDQLAECQVRAPPAAHLEQVMKI